MPFIPAIIAAGSAIAGGIGMAKAAGAQKKAQQQAQTQADKDFQMAQEELARKKAVSQPVLDAMQRYLTGSGEGYDPNQLALMKSQFLNNNSAQFNNAAEGVRSSLLARGGMGGMLPVGGDWGKQMSSLAAARASNASSGIMNVNLQNLQAALANRFNASSLQTAIANGADPAPFLQAGNGAMNINASLVNQGGKFSGALLGAGLAGLSGLFKPKFGGSLSGNTSTPPYGGEPF